MSIGVNDETAAEAVRVAANLIPDGSDAEMYLYVRAISLVPVSRRQVSTTMRAIRRALRQARKGQKGPHV